MVNTWISLCVYFDECVCALGRGCGISSVVFVYNECWKWIYSTLKFNILKITLYTLHTIPIAVKIHGAHHMELWNSSLGFALHCIVDILLYWQCYWVKNEKDVILKCAVPVYLQWVDFLGPRTHAFSGGEQLFRTATLTDNDAVSDLLFVQSIFLH